MAFLHLHLIRNIKFGLHLELFDLIMSLKIIRKVAI